MALSPHACWVRGRNKGRSRKSALWLTPVSAVASLTVGINLVQPKARPISPRGRRLPQPGVCPDLVDAAGFTSRAISPPHALKLRAYSSGLSNSTWACIRRSSSCFA